MNRTNAVIVAALAVFAASLAGTRIASAQGVGTVVALSESVDRAFTVTAVRDGRDRDACRTPCRLRLAPGRYELRAEGDDRVLRVGVTVARGGRQWVRFGVDDGVARYTGLVLTMAGVGATVLATDSLRYTVSHPCSGARPLASQYFDGFSRDIALATSVALLPAAFALLSRGTAVSRSALRRGVALDGDRLHVQRVRLSSLSAQLMSGGGMLGFTLAY